MGEEITLKEKILEQLKSLPEEQATLLREKIEDMNSEEFEKFLQQYALPLQECIFCQISQGKIETIKIYESQNLLGVLDINPVSIGHAIVMPKQHYQFLTQLPDALLFEIFSFVKYIIPAIIRTVKSQGVTINILQGKEQAVPHFAVNIIPRFKEDKLNFAFKRTKISRDELEKIASAIRTEASGTAKQLAVKTQEIEKSERKEEIEEESKTEGIEQAEEENAEEKITSNIEIPEEELEKFFRGRTP